LLQLFNLKKNQIMKKHLLITTGIFVSGLLAAQVAGKASQKVSKIPAHLSTISRVKSAAVTDTYQQLPFTAVTKTKTDVVINKTKRVNAVSEMAIGTTNYDLQSNGSVGDRIVVNADGSIAAVWTFATGDGGTYADRGTGYNYFDGTTWGPVPTARIENVRVGWGNVVNTRSGREVVLSHGSSNQTNLATRAVKGTGTWANSNSTLPNVSGGNWWPRMVSSNPRGGDTIYAISITYPVANGGTAYMGLDGALLFSRSTDGGVTWDIANQIPAGFTTANYTGFSGDGYAIAANGSTVAIIAGDSGADLTMSKSTDGGNTWTATTVMQFPIPLWDPTTVTSDINGDSVADTLETNDGNLAIALDNYGKAYVAYGRMKILNDAPDANGYSYFPYIDGLYVWSEGMPTQMAGLNPGNNFAAFIQDLYGDNYISFPTVPSGSFPFGLTRANSLTSFPSMAFDASNNLYLSYSAIVDSLSSLPHPEKLVRHQYITKSCDGGVNWSDPLDLDPNDPNLPQEGIYGSLAKNIDGNLHIIYQRDLYPGNGIPGASTTNPDGDQLDAGNDMIYVKVPITDITCPIITAIKNEASSVSTLSFYPNPATTNGTIDVVLKENAKMDIVVMNAVGQTVFTTSVNGNTGSNKVDVNLSNLSNGVYFYQVKIANNSTITNKFVVGK
jgi:hypothetical protein